MKLQLPNMHEILKPEAAHEPGFGINTYSGRFKKQLVLEQGSTPNDNGLLKKLGLKKNEKVLAIAGYYASWASELARMGDKVDYSDISSSMVKWARQRYNHLFGKYICSNYELLPKKEKEYDWTFAFEACGGKRGLALAYLRSLLNKKGGILALLLREDAPEKMGSKLAQYPIIVKTLAELYHCKSDVKIEKINGHRKMHELSVLEHQISRITTNDSSRALAEQDLRVLNYVQKKRKIDTEKYSHKLGLSTAELTASLKRLSKLTERCIDEKFRKEIEIQ
jgi:hypothetical protein